MMLLPRRYTDRQFINFLRLILVLNSLEKELLPDRQEQYEIMSKPYKRILKENVMKDKILNFINSELERLSKIEPNVPDTIDDDSWWDGEDCYTDGHNDGKYYAYMTIKKMIEEE